MSISDIKHVVILMQENRSFDEYFGMLAGATGFGDPAFATPSPSLPCKPFRNSTFSASGEIRPGLSHGWADMQGYYKTNFQAPTTPAKNMGYYAPNDIPYHHVLANTFLVCDHWCMSALGGTAANRLYLMSGCLQDPAQFVSSGWQPPAAASTGPSAGIAQSGGAQLENPVLQYTLINPVNQGTNPFLTAATSALDPGDQTNQFVDNSNVSYMLSWQSYPATLAAAAPAGVTWNIYDESNLTDYSANLPPSPANGWGSLNIVNTFENPGFTNLPDQPRNFIDDIKNNALPTISWLIPPLGATEWEDNPACNGAYYIAQKLDAILDNPQLWLGTVFIVIYDECGGNFDHVPPNPPTAASEVAGSAEQWVEGPAWGNQTASQPIGPGFRVPAIIISPWTVNRAKKPLWDCSAGSPLINGQPMDHTAVLQLLGLLTGAPCPNIASSRLNQFPWSAEAAWDRIFDWANPMDAPSTRLLLPLANDSGNGGNDVRTYQLNTLTRLLPYLNNTQDTPANLDLQSNGANPIYAPASTAESPWPPAQQTLYFLELSQTSFGLDDVQATELAQQSSSASFPFALVLDGFEPNELAGCALALNMPLLAVAPRNLNPTLYLVLSADASGADPVASVEIANLAIVDPNGDPPPSAQLVISPARPATRWTINFDLVFTNPAATFSLVTANAGNPVNLTLSAIFSSNLDWSTSIPIQLVAKADPFMVAGEVSYLSRDLRAYQVTDDGTANNPFGVAFGPDPNSYLQAVLTSLNDGSFAQNPTLSALVAAFASDPAIAPSQDAEDAQEANYSQVTHYPTVGGVPGAAKVYNFAIARVTLQGVHDSADNVQVFFRLFPSVSAGTYYDAATFYPATLDAATGLRLPGVGMNGSDVATIPFFAAARAQVTPASPDLANWKAVIKPNSGGAPVYAYFGCYLDINGTSTIMVQGAPRQIASLAASEHQCLVAEISFQGVEIATGANPGTDTDKLSQRNLAVLGGA